MFFAWNCRVSLQLLTIQDENKTQEKFPLCPRSQSQREDPTPKNRNRKFVLPTEA